MGIDAIIAAIICAASTGFLFGILVCGNTNKRRTRALIAFLVNKMEQLRIDSKIKVVNRNTERQHGNLYKADYLTRELEAESIIFLDIQKAISDWCITHNEKDPFAL